MRPLPNSETLLVPALAVSPYAPGATSRGPVKTVTGGTAVANREAQARVAEESLLTRQAVEGDGAAFATLYARYERRVYNLCYRILGSADDAADATQEAFLSIFGRLPKLAGRELNFGSYLFTSARNASYDLIKRRGAARPTDEIPESAAPVGAGTGGDGGSDPGAPEDDPARNVLLEAQQNEIRLANARLPERQREVLALRELEGLSYDEIAEIMQMNRNSVAQLISRARINLRDALRSTALASIAGSTPDCERALPLIALGDDRQPRDRDDARWLKGHLAVCHTCSLSREAMAEAGASYRAWAPVAAAPWLFDDTIAKAAELAGANWSEIIERGRPREELARRAGRAGGAGARVRGLFAHARGDKPRRDILLAAALAALLLAIVFVEATHDVAPSADEATAEPTSTQTTAGRPRRGGARASKRPKEGAATQDARPRGQRSGGASKPSSGARARRDTATSVGSGDGDTPGIEPPPPTFTPPPAGTSPAAGTPPPAGPTTEPSPGDTAPRPERPPPPPRCFDPTGRPIPCSIVANPGSPPPRPAP